MLDLSLKKNDSKRPLKRIKLEPMEALCCTSHPKSDEAVMIARDRQENRSGSQLLIYWQLIKSVNLIWVKIGHVILLDTS